MRIHYHALMEERMLGWLWLHASRWRHLYGVYVGNTATL